MAPSTTRSAAAFYFGEFAFTASTRMQAAFRLENTRVAGTQALFPADFLGGSGPVVEQARARAFAPMSASLGLLQDLPYG
ncbi:hypothetical protein, partial [Escherichia coli]|uniref:hypothetical protein n=1 Tax=Escherichia coli TaxID=562 RepID=UPI00195442A0